MTAKRRAWRPAMGPVAVALLFAAATSAPADEPATAPAELPAPKPLPGEPPSKLAKDIVANLKPALDVAETGEDVARKDRAQGELARRLMEWRGMISPDDPLRNVAWWRERLQGTLPSDPPRKRGLSKQTTQFSPDGGPKREYQFWINVPNSYSVKDPPLPMVVAALPAGVEAAKKTLEQHYASLLKTHLVLGWPADAIAEKKPTSAPHPRNIWIGILYMLDTYRVDRERITIDGFGAAAGHAATVAGEAAVQWNGFVLRNPDSAGPVPQNLTIAPALLVLPELAASKAADAIRAAVPGLKELTGTDAAGSFTDQAAAIQEWIAALPPRRTSDPAYAYTFHCRTVDEWKDGGWVKISRFVDAGADVTARASVTYDRKHGIVDVRCQNVAEIGILLNDERMDLDHPVRVRVNGILLEDPRAIGGTSWKLDRSLEEMITWAASPLGGRNFCATARLQVEIPREAWLTEEQRKALEPPPETPPESPPKEGDGDAGGSPAEEAPKDPPAGDAPPADPPKTDPPGGGTEGSSTTTDARGPPVAAAEPPPADGSVAVKDAGAKGEGAVTKPPPAVAAYDEGLAFLGSKARDVTPTPAAPPAASAPPAPDAKAPPRHTAWGSTGAEDKFTPDPLATALAVLAHLDRPVGPRLPDRLVVDEACRYLLSAIGADGGVPHPSHPTAATATTVEALLAAGTAVTDPAVERAVTFVRRAQFVEATPRQEGDRAETPANPRAVGPEDGNRGGFAAGPAALEADLAATRAALDALVAAGAKAEDDAVQRALSFLDRAQSRWTVRSGADGKAKPAGDGAAAPGGGGGTAPPAGATDAGVAADAGGKPVARPSGSMTYALLRCYRAAGRGAEDERVQAALRWAAANYDWARDPGSATGKERQGLFEYRATAARVLKELGDEALLVPAPPVPEGQPVPPPAHRPWRTELRRTLLAEKSATGAWGNPGDPGPEGSSEVATALALRALAATLTDSDLETTPSKAPTGGEGGPGGDADAAAAVAGGGEAK